MLTKSIKKITTWVIGISLLVILAFPSTAYACACCADAGQWSEASRKISDFDFQEINSLQFAPNPKLFSNASGDDGIRGISPNSGNLTLSVTKKQRNWSLLFKDGSGKTGTLNFTIPQSMVDFRTDFFGNQQGGGPVLYKEFRFEGKVTGNGIFSRGITSDAKYRLVLQGTGGNCTIGSEFKSWNLQVFGSRAAFSFYGLFK